ncbi:MAG: sodium/proline symporter PutP [Alphaproteobacteria bacterium]
MDHVDIGVSTYLGFAIYMAAMFGIGLYFYFRTKNYNEYILGGRTLGPFPSAISSVASDFSGWLLLGLPGFAYSGGMGAFWIAFGLFLGTSTNWMVIAPRLREQSERFSTLTIPDFLEKKLGDPTGILRIALAIAILFFFVGYTASGFVAGGKLFNSLFGLNYTTAMLIAVAVVLSYTFLGGYLAVSWTDVVQGLLMITALIIIPIMAMGELGGASATFSKVSEVSPHQMSFFKNLDGSNASLLVILSLMAWGLGYFGQPHILARFMGIRSVEAVKPARIIAILWTFFGMGAAIFIGLIGIAYFADNEAGRELLSSDPEKVYLALISALSHPIIAGLLLAAVMAAIMSTADSQLLVASSAFTSDLLSKHLSPEKALLFSRVAVVVIAVIATIIATNPDSSILGMVGNAWAGLGASCGSVVLFSLTWKKTNYLGGIAGVIVGALTVVFWIYGKKAHPDVEIFGLYELFPGCIAAAIALVVVSFGTQSIVIPKDYGQNAA